MLDVLGREPERQTIALTAVESARSGVRWGSDPTIFLWWEPADGDEFGAVVATPRFPLLLAAVPPSTMQPLVDELVGRGLDLIGVNAEPAGAEDFTSRWTRATGTSAEMFMRQRLYRLVDHDALTPPVPGQARRAGASDADLVVRWYTAFNDEAAPGQPHVDLASVVRHRIDAGLVWLWEHDGTAVALASRSQTAAGVARVGPVYTPADQRRRGYAAAVTAACTRAALEQGADGVVLFTDLANRTTNAIYQQIGYRPVEDRVIVRFSRA